jgi:hypothetical protein
MFKFIGKFMIKLIVILSKCEYSIRGLDKLISKSTRIGVEIGTWPFFIGEREIVFICDDGYHFLMKVF